MHERRGKGVGDGGISNVSALRSNMDGDIPAPHPLPPTPYPSCPPTFHFPHKMLVGIATSGTTLSAQELTGPHEREVEEGDVREGHGERDGDGIHDLVAVTAVKSGLYGCEGEE